MHRWEDYVVEIRNKANAILGTLGTTYKFSGQTRMYGDFGCALTFSLERSDPWASVLGDGELHFIKVWRSGVRIWSGYQVKLERNDDQDAELNYIDFSFLPLSRLLSWRAGLPVAGTTLASSGLKCDDAIK